MDGVVEVEVAEAGAGGEVGEPAGTMGRPRPEGVRRCSVGATGWGVGDGAGEGPGCVVPGGCDGSVAGVGSADGAGEGVAERSKRRVTGRIGLADNMMLDGGPTRGRGVN